MLKGLPGLFIFIVVCLSVGALGSLATQSSVTTWYADLRKPFLNPPSWVFAPVWTTLYLMIAAAGWKIWNAPSPAKNRLRLLFVLQLALNGLWSFLFFGLRNPALGLAGILLLVLCLGSLILLARREAPAAAWLLTPYFLWTSFAAYLNAAFYWLNR